MRESERTKVGQRPPTPSLSIGQARKSAGQKHAPTFSLSNTLTLQRCLRQWFGRHARDLPWRRSRDPYAIWVSEVMLQQTQVANVVPYFQRFMQRFPTVTDLARAPEQDVLRLWQGLGYYRRARDLHRAAQILCRRHAGQIPRDREVAQSLPGFGRYTAGAVLSQAYDCRLPILEANSQRVLCRLLGFGGDPRTGSGQRFLWRAAEALLPRRQPGEFNQALMELGALVCTAKAPQCSACPWRSPCRARRLRLQQTIPLRPQPVAAEVVHEVAVVVRRGGQVLLAQRPGKGRWAGLWEFPHGPLQPGETHDLTALRILADLTRLRVDLGQELTTLRHPVTRFRITLVCLQARYLGGRFRSSFYSQGRWVEIRDLPSYPVSSPQRRLIQAVTGWRQGIL